MHTNYINGKIMLFKDKCNCFIFSKMSKLVKKIVHCSSNSVI